MTRTLATIALATVLVVLAVESAHGQCAMCSQAVEDSARGDGGSLALGLQTGILVMLGVVLTIGTGLTLFIVRIGRAETMLAAAAGGAARPEESASAGDAAGDARLGESGGGRPPD